MKVKLIAQVAGVRVEKIITRDLQYAEDTVDNRLWADRDELSFLAKQFAMNYFGICYSWELVE